MPQFPHDDFAKAYLPELLRPIGIAIPNHPLKAESRFADLWFVRSNTINPEDLDILGLIGTLLTRDSLIEVFRNAATLIEIRASQNKLFYQEIDEINQAKRDDKKLTETDLPWLWLDHAHRLKTAYQNLLNRPHRASRRLPIPRRSTYRTHRHPPTRKNRIYPLATHPRSCLQTEKSDRGTQPTTTSTPHNGNGRQN